MNVLTTKKIVLLGMMSRHPEPGVVWQTMHYLIGFQRLGFDVYYVEAHGVTPNRLIEREEDDGSIRAAEFIGGIMRRFDLQDHWAFHALHAEGRCYGLTKNQLYDLYDSADLIVNLHGGTMPRPEHYATGRLIYLETDPVAVQIELYHNIRQTIDFLAPHVAFFTFGENYGKPDCKLPISERFHFQPTRQAVVLDFWQSPRSNTRDTVTTVGNWRQLGRDQEYLGQVYYWSKDREFEKFLDLPSCVQQSFELALSSCNENDRQLLESKGWHVQDAHTVSTNLDVYRDYIVQSRAEFTVAKDQNVQLRSGWFSDRSATYLAAGRPVITQETGFSNNLPTGEGLFGFTTLDEIIDAVQRINSDYERHSRAASEIAREYFSHGVVLTQLLAQVGVELAHPTNRTLKQESKVELQQLSAVGGSPVSENGEQNDFSTS